MTIQSNTAHRILIVDDEPTNIHMLAEALKGDYEVRFATDAARALEIAAGLPLDLVLLDVVMPGVDGFEVLRRLKSDSATRNVPVIFVTAMHEIDDEQLGFSLGAVDYITKPVRPSIVRARVRTHIELKRQRDLLERYAFIDGLTGIANRRRFDDVLQSRWNAAQRHGTPLALMLLDVDHFKLFNDTYGHGPGDDCLRRVAGALAQTFSRGDDLVARYGGEEFAVILSGDDATELQADRVLRAVSALGIPHCKSGAANCVSVSIGAVETVPQAGTTSLQAMALADQLLYEAKQGGRNQCAFLSEPNDERRVVHGPKVAA